MYFPTLPTVQPPASTPPHPALLGTHSALPGAHSAQSDAHHNQRPTSTEPDSHHLSSNPGSKQSIL